MDTVRSSRSRDAVYLDYQSMSRNMDLQIDHVGYSENAPNAHTDMDRREHHILHYVVRGKGVFTCKNVEYPMQAGCIYLFPKNTSVSYRADHLDPWVVCYAGFYGGKSDYFIQQLGLSADNVVLRREPDDRIPSLYQMMINEAHSENASRTMLAGYFYLIIGTLLHDLSGHEDLALPIDLFHAITNYINSSLDRPLRLYDIANTFHISQSQMFRIFKAKCGLSPQQYVEDAKIEYACHLIRNTPCSFREISNQCGYEYESHFYKSFCKIIGMTPSKYRCLKENNGGSLQDNGNK